MKTLTQTAKRKKPFLKIGIVSLFIQLCFFSIASFGQNVIVHTTSYEDGNPKLDADGEKNGIVVWTNNKIHVADRYVVASIHTLKISANAIVKIGTNVIADTNGVITSWSSGGSITSSGGVIQIEGATITDIRDDSEGGDINKDGTATGPGKEGVCYLDFYNTGSSCIKNSKLKYFYEIRNIGSMEISYNQFYNIYTLWGWKDWSNPPQNITPTISNNTFELVDDRGRIDLRGLAPIVDGNTFKYVNGAVNHYGSSSFLEAGSMSYDSDTKILPVQQYITISNNVFETVSGIKFCYGRFSDPNPYVNPVFRGYILRAKVYGNVFRGTVINNANASGSDAIRVPVLADINISKNEMNNFSSGIYLADATVQDYSQVHINQNWFFKNKSGSGNAISRSSFNVQSFMVDATHNYWGDPTGPFDVYNDDGISNPRGNGMSCAKYVNYIPFIGGTTQMSGDKIHITVETIDPLPGLPLAPNANVSIRVTVDNYKLTSANSGKIIIYVRDEGGILYNLPLTEVNVTAVNNTIILPIINFKTPYGTDNMTVEARLIPDGFSSETISNIVSLNVLQVPSSLTLIEMVGENNLRIGESVTLKPKLKYSIPTNGKIEFNSFIVSYKHGDKLYEYPTISVNVQPAINNIIEYEIPTTVPLLNYEENGFLFFMDIKLLNASGNIISAVQFTNILLYGWRVEVHADFYPRRSVGIYLIPTDFFNEDDNIIFNVQWVTTIRIPNLTNMHLKIDRLEFYKDGRIIQSTNVGKAVDQNINSGNNVYQQKIEDLNLRVPLGIDKLKVVYSLYVPDKSVTIYRDSESLPIHPKPSITVERNIVQGSTVQFAPLPITINVSSNSQAGNIIADEISSSYGSSKSWNKLGKGQEQFYKYWALIPIKKYWNIYGNPPFVLISGTITFSYNPLSDFPSNTEFKEDSLVIAGRNNNSGELEVLNTTINKTNRTLSTSYDKFFQTWVIASKKTKILSNIKQDYEKLPAEFVLFQNYPNPFNPNTTIKFSIPHSAFITLKVYDVLGREVETLVNELKAPGYYTVEWQPESLSSGIYFYGITAGNYNSIKKLVYLK